MNIVGKIKHVNSQINIYSLHYFRLKELKDIPSCAGTACISACALAADTHKTDTS